MSYIDFEKIQAAGSRLLEQVSILEQIRDELEYTEQKIRTYVYTEQTVHEIKKSRQELEAEIAGLQKMSECLYTVTDLVKKTEQKITETYDLDTVTFSPVRYQTSRIRVEEGCESLFSFRN